MAEVEEKSNFSKYTVLMKRQFAVNFRVLLV
jgi:hypothetical protein